KRNEGSRPREFVSQLELNQAQSVLLRRNSVFGHLREHAACERLPTTVRGLGVVHANRDLGQRTWIWLKTGVAHPNEQLCADLQIRPGASERFGQSLLQPRERRLI